MDNIGVGRAINRELSIEWNYLSSLLAIGNFYPRVTISRWRWACNCFILSGTCEDRRLFASFALIANNQTKEKIGTLRSSCITCSRSFSWKWKAINFLLSPFHLVLIFEKVNSSHAKNYANLIELTFTVGINLHLYLFLMLFIN